MILAVSAFATMVHAMTTQAVDIVLAALLLIGGVVGAQYGARLATRLKPDLLRLALAVIILLVALRMALGLAWRPDEIYTVSSCEGARAPSSLALAPLLLSAASPRLVPDISARSIAIRYSFTGAQLLLFGAILYPGGRVPSRAARHRRRPQGPGRADPGAREAEDRRHLDERRQAPLPARRRAFTPSPRRKPVARAGRRAHRGDLRARAGGAAIVVRRRRAARQGAAVRGRAARPAQAPAGSIPNSPGGVEISEGVLYRARIAIPSQVPVGTYTAETFLIDDGRVIAAATRDIDIGKSGFERFVALAASRHGFLYGLAAVLLSVGHGLGGGLGVRPPRLTANRRQSKPNLNPFRLPPGRSAKSAMRVDDDRPTQPAAVRRPSVELQRRGPAAGPRRPGRAVGAAAGDRRGARHRRVRLAGADGRRPASRTRPSTRTRRWRWPARSAARSR